MYIKAKSYPLKQMGIPVAFVMIKMHILTFKFKATITMQDGREFELHSQGSNEEEFDLEIQEFVSDKMY